MVNTISEFVNMGKFGQSYLIQNFHSKDLSPTNIKAQLESTRGSLLLRLQQ